MNDFMKNAKGLAKNPLGIVALFISLIYGFACLVLGIAANNLENNERLPLIWFLVIFPLIVLAAFVYLVIYHHGKLYSPLDFRYDRSFLETINKDHKIAKEYDESQYVEEDTDQSIPSPPEKKTNQKTSQIKPEVLEFNDFKSKYLKIEDSAIQQIENIYCAQVKRNVRIKGISRAEFDGVIVKDDEIIFIEIKYVRSITMGSPIINSLRELANQVREFYMKGDIERKVTLLIFLVFDVTQLDFLFPQIDNLERELKQNSLNVIILKKHISSLLSE